LRGKKDERGLHVPHPWGGLGFVICEHGREATVEDRKKKKDRSCREGVRAPLFGGQQAGACGVKGGTSRLGGRPNQESVQLVFVVTGRKGKTWKAGLNGVKGRCRTNDCNKPMACSRVRGTE